MPNEPCNCGFDIPAGGTLGELHLTTPLEIASGGTGANTAAGARSALGITSGYYSLVVGSTLIQCGTVAINMSGIANGGTADSGQITFATAYDNVPTVILTGQYDYAVGYFTYCASSVSSSGFKVTATNVIGSTAGQMANRYVNWIAIGGVSNG